VIEAAMIPVEMNFGPLSTVIHAVRQGVGDATPEHPDWAEFAIDLAALCVRGS
jgi:hypothetical protein